MSILPCCVLASARRTIIWRGRLLLGKQRGKEICHALPELEALMRIQDQRLYERLGWLAARFPDGFEGEAGFCQ